MDNRVRRDEDEGADEGGEKEEGEEEENEDEDCSNRVKAGLDKASLSLRVRILGGMYSEKSFFLFNF